MKTIQGLLGTSVVLACLCSGSVHAGNETRGTNAEVLVGMSVRRKFDAAAEARFQQRVGQIRQYILSGHLKERVRAFVEQADETSFLPQSNPNLPSTSRALTELRRRGVWSYIDRLQIDLAETRPDRICAEQPGVARAASTQTRPGAPVCADPELVALFELGIAKMELQQSTVNDFLFGIIMHEIARWYDLDQDHSFLFAAAEEVTHQTLIEHRLCPNDSNLCLYKQTSPLTNKYEKNSRIIWDRTQSSKLKVEVQYKEYSPLVDCVSTTSIELQGTSRTQNDKHLAGRIEGKDPLTARAEFNLSDLLSEQTPIPKQVAQIRFRNTNSRSNAARVYNSETFNTSGGLVHRECQSAEVRILNQEDKVVASLDQHMTFGGEIELRGWRRPQTYQTAEASYNRVAPLVDSLGFSADKRETWAKAKIESELSSGVRCETLTFQELSRCVYESGNLRSPETLRYACVSSVQKGVLTEYDVKLVQGVPDVTMRALTGGFDKPIEMYRFEKTGFYNTIEIRESFTAIRQKVWDDLLPKMVATAGRTSTWKDIPWHKARYSWSPEGVEVVSADSKLQFLTTNSFEFGREFGVGKSNEPFLYLGKSKKVERVFRGYDGGGKEAAKYVGMLAASPALLPLAPIALWKPFGPFKTRPSSLQFSRCRTLAP